jgi:hypothetical protein
MAYTSIADPVRGQAALVSTDGDLHVRVGNILVVEVEQVLEVRRAAVEAFVAQETIGSSSATLLGSRPGRQKLVIQNTGAQTLFVNPSGGTATTSDLAIAPGATMVIDAPVDGAIKAVTGGSNTTVVVWEFA